MHPALSTASAPPDRDLPPEQDHGGTDLWPMGPPDRPSTPWPWWYGVVGLVAGIAAAVGLVLLVFGLLRLPWGEPYGEFLVIGTVVGVIVLLARRRGPLSARLFGLQPTPARAAVGWVVVTYVLQVIVMGIWLSVSQSHYTNVPRGGSGHLVGGTLGLIVAVTVIAPIAEEIIFRGFLYGALRNRLGTGAAAAISGVIFGCTHLTTSGDSWQIVPPLAFFGIALCLLYERTGSILPCIATHMLLNGIAIGIATRSAGPIALVLLAAGALFLLAPWRWFRRRPQRQRAGMRMGATAAS